MNIYNMMCSLWNNKNKINRIMKKLTFCESLDVYMDNIEYFSIGDIIYMTILCTEQS